MQGQKTGRKTVRSQCNADQAHTGKVILALAGDTMLGRGVAEQLRVQGPGGLFAPELLEIVAEADLFLLNLECSISERGEPASGNVFHFRAPPAAVTALAGSGVSAVTLANNHALDYGPEALLDSFDHLGSAGIDRVGAGRNLEQARAPLVLEAQGFRLAVIALADHPTRYAATSDRPGIAYADLAEDGVPDWLRERIRGLDADAVLVTPHWGPNMVSSPLAYVREAAQALLDAGATLVAGHSAHVFQGVSRGVLFDLGDFIDDYRVDPGLRNDLGLLFMVDLDSDRLEAIPLKLEYAYTRLAEGDEAVWIRRRFRKACAAFATEVSEEEGRLVVRWR
jgi:poly-gamma-glutamate capsule biosynthesis protein CapA/YwtB (metallophosphatase superfamily)